MEFEDLKVEVPLDEEEDNPPPLLDVPIKKYQNNDGNFVTGFDVTSKEAQEKRLKRAARFGIPAESSSNQLEDSSISNSVDNLPRTSQDAEIRPDAILLFGVNEMSTKDVFDYFKDYMPGSIEWIDDMSCVVVWDDENSAKRALVNMGTKYTPAVDDKLNQEPKVENIWRIGTKHPKAKQLVMRYATKLDKKAKGASSRSLYYLIHGNPNQTKQKAKKRGLVSSSRRRKILADQLRVDDELTPAPDVEILNADAVQTGDFDDEMDVDEPPVKVIISEDPIGELLQRGNLYADRKKNSAKNARARLRKRRDDDDVFSSSGNGVFLDRLSSSVKMDEALDARLRVTESEVPTKNFQVSDLREKLEHRKQAFNSRTRPNLSIEITED